VVEGAEVPAALRVDAAVLDVSTLVNSLKSESADTCSPASRIARLQLAA